MKKFTRIILAFSFLFSFSQFLKASHGLPLVGASYTIGATGITVSGNSDAATCGSGPFWMQTKVSCSPSAFANTPPDACIKSYLQNWTNPAVNYNAFPWYNALLNVPNYTSALGWSDACTLEPYHNNFIPFTDLCPGKVYYFATREIVTGGFGSPGPFGPVVSFTVPGSVIPEVPGFVSSSPVTSPSSPSCGGPVLLTFTKPQGCGPVKALVPGCPTCDSIVWFGPSGVIAVNTLTVLVTPLSTTTYTVKYDTCSAATKEGCGLPYNPLITVYVANTNAAFASVPTLCAGSMANFIALFPALNDLWTVSPTTSVTPSSGTGPNFSPVFDDPGTFVVTHQSMNGSCMDVQSQTVTITPGITTSITTTGGGCSPPTTTGAATVAVTSSTTGITYLWTPGGSTTDSQSGLTYNTTYSVTLSNGGCTITRTLSIANIVADGTFSASSSTICSGSTVTFNALATSTSDSWSVTPTTSVTPSTSSGATFSPVFDAPGTYTVIHQATNGACIDTQTNTITVTPGITASISTTGGGCASGGSTGSATVSVTSPTTGLTYSWSPSGGTSNVETNIPFNTTYSVVLSQGGCVITKTVVITNNPPPSITSFSVTSPLCNGQLNGTVGVNLTSGNPPFSFTWSPTITQTTQTVTGVGAGTYSVMVTDNNGCTTSDVVTVNQPSVLTLTTSPSATICSGTSYTLASVAGGGTPVYSYTWNPGNMNVHRR